MNPDDVKTLIGLRMDEAKEVLSDARYLLESGRGFRTVVNRAYYAAFYASLAILQTCGKAPRSHAGAMSLLGSEFAKKGLIPDETVRLMRRLFDLRQEDDYRRLTPITRDEAAQALADAEEFVRRMGAFLENPT